MRMRRLKQQRDVLAALDIGSNKVCCMIAQYTEKARPHRIWDGTRLVI